MKNRLKKWIFRFAATAMLMSILLLIIIVNPFLTYANKTTISNVTVYHNKNIDTSFISEVKTAIELLQKSELSDSKYKIDICLNDGSIYPRLIELLQGRVFAWGFYNKVVLQGSTNSKKNYTELNGYKWNFTQLLTHEIIHCLQFNALGFFKSKPIANIPKWKWEGYAEYVARQNADQKNLKKSIEYFINSNQTNWEITFEDGTITPREYYNYWLLLKYCIEVKRITFTEILSDSINEDIIRSEMMKWYNANI